MFEAIVSIVSLFIKWYTASANRASRLTGWLVGMACSIMWSIYFLHSSQWWAFGYSIGAIAIALRGIFNNRPNQK